MAVGPFTMIATVSGLYKIIGIIAKHTHGAGIPVIDSFFDIATGIAGALFVCSPMIIATWELWLFPKSHGIKFQPGPPDLAHCLFGEA